MKNGRDSAQFGREIAALEEYCKELSDAIGEFEHEARRCRDKLERIGGQSHQFSRKLMRLEQNLSFNRKELEEARRRIAELKQKRTSSG